MTVAQLVQDSNYAERRGRSSRPRRQTSSKPSGVITSETLLLLYLEQPACRIRPYRPVCELPTAAIASATSAGTNLVTRDSIIPSRAARCAATARHARSCDNVDTHLQSPCGPSCGPFILPAKPTRPRTSGKARKNGDRACPLQHHQVVDWVNTSTSTVITPSGACRTRPAAPGFHQLVRGDSTGCSWMAAVAQAVAHLAGIFCSWPCR